MRKEPKSSIVYILPEHFHFGMEQRPIIEKAALSHEYNAAAAKLRPQIQEILDATGGSWVDQGHGQEFSAFFVVNANEQALKSISALTGVGRIQPGRPLTAPQPQRLNI